MSILVETPWVPKPPNEVYNDYRYSPFEYPNAPEQEFIPRNEDEHWLSMHPTPQESQWTYPNQDIFGVSFSVSQRYKPQKIRKIEKNSSGNLFSAFKQAFSEITEDEWKNIPEDSSENVDKYL